MTSWEDGERSPMLPALGLGAVGRSGVEESRSKRKSCSCAAKYAHDLYHVVDCFWAAYAQALAAERGGMEEALKETKAKDNILPKIMATNQQVGWGPGAGLQVWAERWMVGVQHAHPGPKHLV